MIASIVEELGDLCGVRIMSRRGVDILIIDPTKRCNVRQKLPAYIPLGRLGKL